MLTDDTPTCTCAEHAENPRPIEPFGTEYIHADDRTYAWTIHLHGYRWSRDCDGAMSTEYVLTPAPSDKFADHDVLWAHAAMLDQVPLACERGDVNVRLSVDRLEASGPTDEGGFQLDIEVCQHPDCAPTFERRDYQAEAAGY